MTILNPYRAAGLFSAASFLLSAAGTAHAQERVTTYWDGARSGMFEDESAWTFGFPNNTADTLWDAVIDATGSPYTVRFESDFGTPDIVLQTLTLDSTDATLELVRDGYGELYIEEAFNFNAGTLRLKDAALRGTQPNTRMDIGGDARFDFMTNGSSQHMNALNNFDVYGGDLIIESTAQLNLTDTHIKEGALVYRTFTGSNNITIESTIDFDIRFENSSTRRNELITHVDGLVITEGVTISGSNFWLSPEGSGYPDWLPASFINNGTIRLEGGDARISSTRNLGLIDVVAGELTLFGDNEGTIKVHEGASLDSYVSTNGTDVRFLNTGFIDVSGPGANLEIYGFFPGKDGTDFDYWTNEGTVRLSDHARARIGSMSLAGVGDFQRDATSRIEITGGFNLGGATMDSNTFDGDVHITYDNPGGSGGARGEITNGTIDLTRDWLKFTHYYGYISDTEFIGGDLVISTEPGNTWSPTVVLDDFTIRDGGLILGDNGHIGFGEQYGSDGISFFDTSLTTTNSEGKIAVWLFDRVLQLGTSAFVSGNLDLGLSSNTTHSIYNEGLVVSTATSGDLDMYLVFNNHGTVASSDNELMSFQTFNNYREMLLDNAWVSGNTLTNESNITLINQSSITIYRNLSLTEDSELNIEAIDDRASMVAHRTLIFEGVLNLDLTAITTNGIYQLFTAETFIGDFSAINITNLLDNLEFAGFDATTGTYSIVPSPSSFFALSLGVISRTRRKRAE